jgi:hypothetical protein
VHIRGIALGADAVLLNTMGRNRGQLGGDCARRG